MVISVSKNLMFYIILLICSIFLLMICMIYLVINERKEWNKRKFFKYTIYYEVDYFLYIDMVKKMKRILLKKRIEILWLSTLLLFRRILIWNKK